MVIILRLSVAVLSFSFPAVFTVSLASNVACPAYNLFGPPEVFPVGRLTGHQHKDAGEHLCDPFNLCRPHCVEETLCLNQYRPPDS